MLHRLSEHDAACLRASCVITSFSGALRCATDALRALEHSVCLSCVARGFYSEEKGEGNAHTVHASLLRHSFSLTRRVTLHRTDTSKGIAVCEVPCTAWEQLAVLSKDVCLRVELALPPMSGPTHHTDPLSYIMVVHYVWHEGKPCKAYTHNIAHVIPCDVDRFTLRITAEVSDLFYALPVRRAPFVVSSPSEELLHNAPRAVSAAMEWRRRHEQRALINTLFCSALEYLLAPLYLVHHIARNDESGTVVHARRGVPRFTASVNAQDVSSATQSTTHHTTYTQQHGRRRAAASLSDALRIVEGCIQDAQSPLPVELRGLEQLRFCLEGTPCEHTPCDATTAGEVLGARLLRSFFPALRHDTQSEPHTFSCNDAPAQLLHEVNVCAERGRTFVVLFWQPAVLRWLGGTAFGRRRNNKSKHIILSCAHGDAPGVHHGLPCLILSRLMHTHVCSCVEPKAYSVLHRYPSVRVFCICCDAYYLSAATGTPKVGDMRYECCASNICMERFAAAFAQAVALFHNNNNRKAQQPAAALAEVPAEEERRNASVVHEETQAVANNTGVTKTTTKAAAEAPHALRLNYALHRLQSATLDNGIISSSSSKDYNSVDAQAKLCNAYTSHTTSVYRALAQRSTGLCASRAGLCAAATMPGGCRTPILLPLASQTALPAAAAPHRPSSHASAIDTRLIAEAQDVREMQRSVMPRIRALLRSEGIDALGLLRHGFAQPQPWQPGTTLTSSSNSGDGGKSVVRFPVPCTAQTRVMQWARKFIVAIGTTDSESRSKKSANTPVCNIRTALPALSDMIRRQWWLLEQHAVHERLRLEYFMAFAEAYVVHPELPPAPCMSSVRAHTVHNLHKRRRTEKKKNNSSNSSCHARCEPTRVQCAETSCAMLRRLRATEQLMHALDAGNHNHTSSYSTESNPLGMAALLPSDLIEAVTALEPALRRWGWRFVSRITSESTSKKCTRECVAVTHWATLRVEGFELCLDSMQDLRIMVEELTAVAAQARCEENTSDESALHILPSAILRFLVQRSCRGAIMFGDRLPSAAVAQVVRGLACVERFYCCSHGRPSMVHLTPRVCAYPL